MKHDHVLQRFRLAGACRSLSRTTVARSGGYRQPSYTNTILVAGAVVCGFGIVFVAKNQEEAPFTKRRRFMIFKRDGGFLKNRGETAWTFLKLRYKGRVLPKDHKASRTVERVGRRIAEVSGMEGFKWEFMVVRSPEMNAFCLPGGKIVIFTGMLGVTPSEDSLASVLGHEIGHVVANHAGEKASKYILTTVVLMLVQLIVSMLTDTNISVLGNNIVMWCFNLPNSREMEREADFIGLNLMAKACFDPREMPKMFALMEARNKNSPRLPEYASTHPTSDERIAKQKEWMHEALNEYELRRCTCSRQAQQMAQGYGGSSRNVEIAALK